MEITAVRVMGDSGTEYEISVKDGAITCTCPAFEFGDGPCKHIKWLTTTLIGA